MILVVGALVVKPLSARCGTLAATTERDLAELQAVPEDVGDYVSMPYASW